MCASVSDPNFLPYNDERWWLSFCEIKNKKPNAMLYREAKWISTRSKPKKKKWFRLDWIVPSRIWYYLFISFAHDMRASLQNNRNQSKSHEPVRYNIILILNNLLASKASHRFCFEWSNHIRRQEWPIIIIINVWNKTQLQIVQYTHWACGCRVVFSASTLLRGASCRMYIYMMRTEGSTVLVYSINKQCSIRL